MAWDDDLLPEQRVAASHIGSHARLLAGPGTGKTLTMTRRVVYLTQEENIDPTEILVLTFTRAAVHELRERITSELGEENKPRISTLHSFSLRQLMRNVGVLDTVPIPLRIADDWEEKEIICSDIKNQLGLERISQAKEFFAKLSADWESLVYETTDWDPDPRFITAWRAHREIFGYTLRSELVYQLKRALEQSDDFIIESEFKYLLVDEYQDLNCCDLAIIKELTRRGMELYVAGDDDQSIYGFRKAHPQGIRQFSTEYSGSIDLPLQICKRCDQEILSLAEFIAQLDPVRIPKRIRAEEGRTGGEVALLRFRDQEEEAQGVATLCKQMIAQEGLSPHDILILLRVDTHKAFSSKLIDAFNRNNVPVAVDPVESSPLDENEGREVLAFLRLLKNCLNQWEELNHYLLDGRLEIDNNRAERSIKPFVIGRKNFLFSNTPRGAKSSAIIYSIVETAKENNLKPYNYLMHLFEKIPNLDLTDPGIVDGLLPWSESLPEDVKMSSKDNDTGSNA